jgi:glyceraldehyde 3-phosphate dehydrogenase
MTTIHSYTSDQNLHDNSHSDLRRARSAPLSMVPTSTGAAKAIGQVLPALAGKIDGIAIRVPTPNVSYVDFTFTSQQATSKDAINSLFEEASKTHLRGILAYETQPLVSIDFTGNPHSAIVDASGTYVVGDNFCRVAAWYDNEWAFSERMLDVTEMLGTFV